MDLRLHYNENEFRGLELDNIDPNFFEDDDTEDVEMQDQSTAQACGEIASSITKSQTKDTKQIWIYNICRKMKTEELYNICGTYTGTTPDFWFYFTTSVCPGDNHLLNLCVIHRKVGSFRIGISSSNNITEKKCEGRSFLSNTLTHYSFKSSQPDEHHYIKTFCFTESHLKLLTNLLVLPVTIEQDCQLVLDSNIVKQVKNSHNFNELLTKSGTADFVIETNSGKKFDVHRIVLAMHSPQLRSIIKSNMKYILLDISDNDVELLLEYLYTGIIKDIHKQDCTKLLQLADRFQLANLFVLVEHAVDLKITVKNAVELALLSEKYKLEKMQNNVFSFIKNHPDVMLSEGWQKLENSITKKLTQWMFFMMQNDK